MSMTQLTFSLTDNIGNELFFITEANILDSPHLKIITFIEQTDLELKTKVLIYDNHVELYRTGLISMSLDFDLSKHTKAIIKSSYGYEISMENRTLELNIQKNEIYIVYQTSNDMEKGIIHTLKMMWEK